MSLDGWLLDVRIRDDEAILWVKTGGKRVQVKDRYNVDFYVLPEKVTMEKLAHLFDEHDNITGIQEVERFLSIDSVVREPVLRVAVDSALHYRNLTNLVGRYGEIFDNGLSHTQRYLADRGLIPYGEVKIDLENKRVKSIEAVPLDLRIEPPPFKVLCFELSIKNCELEIITLDEGMREEYRFAGDEKETLLAFTEYLRELDPDMLACMEADLKRLFSLQITHGQETFGFFHRKSFHLNEGRTYLNLMTYRRISLAGMVERIQYNREVPRICSNWAAGRAIESRQSYEARRRGYLLPRNGYYQPVMSLEELLRERDHGGLIFAPTVGLHENVGALDFESMFPHLIIKDNISYENVRSEKESEGFLIDFTRDTLTRRLHFKHLRKELKHDPEKYFWCETRQQALKEILFCTYGYSGCWANKFGNMDTFMEINQSARTNLVKAMNIAREQGFHTIYGNSDSLFLKREGATHEDFDSLSKDIAEETELPIAIENHFRYLVLLPQKSGKDFGAINRYYGVRYDGEMVCRGIELRRRNTCAFVADAQRDAIRAMLSKESMPNVLTTGIEDANKVFSKASRLLKQELVPIEELESKTVLRRKPREYKARLPHVAAAEALELNNNDVGRGDVIRYIYVDSEHKNPFRRVSPAGYQKKYDSKKYMRLIEEAKKSILLPFRIDEKKTTKAAPLESFFGS
jgi:DNA polymerase I